MPTEKDILNALRGVLDPELNRNIVELSMVRDLEISPEGTVSFTLALTIPTCPLRNQIAENARNVLLGLHGVKDTRITFGAMTQQERKSLNLNGLPRLNQFNQVKQMIAIMSGKGGVGKSTVSALLATGLAQKGKRVGILDADITGPSIPKLFGLPPGGLRGSEQGILPAITGKGIRIISTNLMLQEDDMPVIWRGPMITGAIRQFWTDALWGRLDFLLVDLPPGTSDAALAVTQDLPLNGVILVTTPQELAAMVVRKAVNMVRQLNIAILGVVENMSYYRCPDNGKLHEVFGPSHVEEIAKAAGVPVSARLPIDPAIATLSDSGKVEEVVLPEMEALVEQVIRL